MMHLIVMRKESEEISFLDRIQLFPVKASHIVLGLGLVLYPEARHHLIKVVN